MEIKRLIANLDLKIRSKNEKNLINILKDLNKTRKDNNNKKIFLTDITSTELTKLLTLLEDKKISVRKMALLILGLLLSHDNSKFYLSEKCGLGLIEGIIFLTRLKYLYVNKKDKKKCLIFLKTLKKKNKQTEEENLFSFLSLEKNNFERMDILNFNSFDIKEKGQIILLENIPDPTLNLCYISLKPKEENLIKGAFLKNFNPTKKKSLGFFLDQKEKNSSKKKFSRKLIKRAIPNTSRSRDKSIVDTRDMTSKSITRRIKNFENTKLKANKRFNFKKEITKDKKVESKHNIKVDSKYNSKKLAKPSNFLTQRKKKQRNTQYFYGNHKASYSPISSNGKKKNDIKNHLLNKVFNFNNHKPN